MIFLPLVFFSPRSAGDDVDLEDYVNRPEKISAADVAAIAQVSTKNRREKAIKETIQGGNGGLWSRTFSQMRRPSTEARAAWHGPIILFASPSSLTPPCPLSLLPTGGRSSGREEEPVRDFGAGLRRSLQEARDQGRQGALVLFYVKRREKGWVGHREERRGRGLSFTSKEER